MQLLLWARFVSSIPSRTIRGVPLRWIVPRFGPCVLRDPTILEYSFPSNATFDEDCLTLNIYAPPNARGLPVFFWIHGGGLTEGGSQELRLRGYALAQQGMVVVTINYRLGVLGFLSLDGSSSGMMGFRDQQMALRFVQKNIAVFGGDPSRVTIGGESAGGSSVAWHLVEPSSAGLFSQAVVESGVPFGESLPVAATQKTGTLFAQSVNCSTIDCLRAIDWKTIMQHEYKLYMDSEVPIGPNLMVSPYRSLLSGSFSKVPLLAGNVADEGTVFLGGYQNVSQSEYPLALAYMATRYEFPNPSQYAVAVQKEYPCSATDCWPVMVRVESDMLLVCQTSAVLRAMQNRTGGSKVFAYMFDVAPTWARDPSLGSFHSSEIEFVFGTLMLARGQATAEELALSSYMTHTWANFIINSDPGFPSFQAPSLNRALFRVASQGGVSVLSAWREQQCQFWNDFLYQQIY